jgi:CRISPR-associated endonuclease/helicase Cas3
MVMTIVDILRAKSKDEENYLLKDHLKETILRAKQLKDFINKNKSAIKYNKFDDNFFEDLIIACFLHDLGKIDFNFQKDVFKKEERETKEFNEIKNFFGSYKKINIKDHEAISLLYSLIFLDKNDRSEKIRTAILLHHYNEFYANRDNINIRYIFDDYPDLRIYIEFLINNKERIEELLKNLLQYLLNNIEDDFTRGVLTRLKNNIIFDKLNEFKQFLYRDFGLSTKLKLFNLPDKEDERNLQLFYDFFVFLGCLRRCDYSASGNVDIEDAKNLKEYVYKDINEKIKDKIKSKDIWQEKVLEQKDYDNMVLIAPTGSGKTEFALLWAKNRGKKLIYTLPLRVALNDLYWRFTDKEKGYFENNILSILHSTSFIEYLKEDKYGEELDIDEKQTISELFSSPLTLTTPDQVFLSSLKYYGFDKIVSTYPLSAVVIDEIQAYNPEMASVIIKTLKIIKELFGNLLIITATFPPYFRKFVNEEDFKIIDIKEIDDEIKRHVKNYNLKRHRIDVLDCQIFEYEENEDNKLRINEQSFKKLKKILVENENKNILIILNNVGKSIELFKKLENDNEIKERIIINDENNKPIPLLLHSRIIEKGKSKRIEAIKKALEKGEKGMVVVSTQLVEVSVDIDFDLLITEISTIDSQIQRWGRIYRNRNSDYNDVHPNIFIFLGIDRGTSAIYDKRVIEKTIEVLKKYQGKLLDYEAERNIIEEVFESKIDNENQTLRDVFIKEIEDNLKWLEYVSLEKRSEAQRVFRRIAGIQVIIPDLMLKGNEIEKAFYEVIKDKSNWKLPFESNISTNSLIDKVKEKINNTLKNQVTKWKLLEILYNYSLNLPIFSFEHHKFEIFEKNNFKGFFVLKTDKVNLDELEKYGINKIKYIDIDIEEIETAENVI